MQPLEVAFFASLKQNWASELELYKFQEGVEPRKHDVIPTFDRILWPNFKTNLKNGFQCCGLQPFQPDNVDYAKCVSATNEKLTSISHNSTDCDKSNLLSAIEKKISISLRKEFCSAGLRGKWIGNENMSGLFYFYKSIKFNLDFEALIKKRTEISYTKNFKQWR